MVLAAGFGKRLRPFTDKVPKPLTKVLGVPMIDVVLDRLENAGVERAVVNLHHLGEQIRAQAPFHINRGALAQVLQGTDHRRVFQCASIELRQLREASRQP